MYFLPEAEFYCHNVSQKLVQNIELVRQFHVLTLSYYYMYVIKFCSNLVVYTYIFKTKRMRSCKIEINGLIQYLMVKKFHHQITRWRDTNIIKHLMIQYRQLDFFQALLQKQSTLRIKLLKLIWRRVLVFLVDWILL